MPRKRVVLDIAGTHCASCEVLLERRLRSIKGVESASVNYATGKAVVQSTRELRRGELQAVINRDGYSLRGAEDSVRPLRAVEYAQIAGLFVFFVVLFVVLKHFDLIASPDLSSGASMGVVFVLGLIAATSTCLAVTGGLLLALAAKYSESFPGLSGVQKLKPTLYFSGGRLAGYAVFGALLGAVGAAMTVTPFASGILTLLAALIMIVLGLQMLRVVPWLNRVHIRVPKFVAHSLLDQSGKAYKPWAPFVVGAGTFFMPCGFTQALQFYVLGHANALQGGITMFVFAAGTMPMLLALGAVSSFTRGVWHSYFVRAAAVLVVLFGLLSIPAGIALVR